MNKLTIEQFIYRYNQKFENTYVILTPPEKFSGQALIEITCDKHGKSNRKVNDLLGYNHACRQCGKDARAQSNKANNKDKIIPYEQHIAELTALFGGLYEYPNDGYKASNDKIRIICNKHGAFELHLLAHKIGRGCPVCRDEIDKEIKEQRARNRIEEIAAGKLRKIAANKSRAIPCDTLEQRCIEKFGERFKYNWHNYRETHKVEIECNKHGKFKQKLQEHLNSTTGCVLCSKSCTTMAGIDWLSKMGVSIIEYRIQINENKFFKVDGFNQITNTAYEYLGDYWHGHPRKWNDGINQNNKIPFIELFKLTEDRFIKLTSLGYNIIYVWENDIKHKLTASRIFKGILEYD